MSFRCGAGGASGAGAYGLDESGYADVEGATYGIDVGGPCGWPGGERDRTYCWGGVGVMAGGGIRGEERDNEPELWVERRCDCSSGSAGRRWLLRWLLRLS